MKKLAVIGLLVLATISVSNAQINLWGLASGGGDSLAGVLFKYDVGTAKDSIAYNFGQSYGSPLYNSLIQATDGNFYGMTPTGGSSGNGVIFKYTSSGVITVLVNFNWTNGSDPQGSLIQATDGNLYGMTYSGGTKGFGTIFKCTTTGTITTLVNFDSTNGGYPYGSLMQAANGSLYGMTSSGGTADYGTLFKCTTTGTLTTLWNFTGGTDGSNPYGGLVQAANGTMYGMTESGAQNGIGTIFKFTKANTLVTLVQFNDTNGMQPYGNLIIGKDGKLYGLTAYGGVPNYTGNLFQCDTLGNITSLVSFNGTSGQDPYGSLVQANDGNLYGMTSGGGANNDGTLFKCTTSGTLTTLINFDTAQGMNPDGSLIQATDGNLYGMVTYGGSNNNGTIIKCSTAGALTVLHNFNSDAGNIPFGNVMPASDKNLYGTTDEGGTDNFGTLFKYNFSGTHTIVVNFNSDNGAYPQSEPIQAKDSNLYGTTTAGGAYGYGTIYKYDISTGVLSTLVNFNGTNGSIPGGPIIQASDGNFYGVTVNGGAFNNGTLFKCTTAGVLTTLVNFNDSDGQSPHFILQGTDGNLYGTTRIGGSKFYGTLYKCTTSGVLTTLVNFNDTTTGSGPWGALIQVKGTLYGMTFGEGIIHPNGTIFKCTTSGKLTSLVNFTGATGIQPEGAGLLHASDGNLYGLTGAGGSYNKGTLFKCDTTGKLNVLFDFNGANGSYPYSTLIEATLVPAAVNNIAAPNADVVLYPNPSKGEFTLKVDEVNCQSVGIYDETGRLVYAKSVEGDNYDKTIAIDMSKFANGIYFVTVTTDRGIINKKVIIQK